jgi:hypothetical protein
MKKKFSFIVALIILVSAFPLNGYAASSLTNGRLVASIPANTYATLYIDLADLATMYGTGERYDYLSSKTGYPISVRLDKDARFGYDLTGNSPFQSYNGMNGTWAWTGYSGGTNDIYAALVALNIREGYWQTNVGPAVAVSVESGRSTGFYTPGSDAMFPIPDNVVNESWYSQIGPSLGAYYGLFNSAPTNYIVTWNFQVISQQEIHVYIQVLDADNGVMTAIPDMMPGNVVVPVALPIYLSNDESNWTSTVTAYDLLSGLELGNNKPSFPAVIPTPAPTATPAPADPSLVTVSNLQVKKSSVNYNLTTNTVNKIKVPDMKVEIKAATAVANMQTSVSKSVLRTIARGEKSLSIATNKVGIALDDAAMAEIFDAADSAAIIAATTYAVSSLPKDIQSDFKNTPVYEFKITEKKNGDAIELDEGTASFKAAYTLKRNEIPEDLIVYQLLYGELVELEEYEYTDGWISWAGDINAVYCVGVN